MSANKFLNFCVISIFSLFLHISGLNFDFAPQNHSKIPSAVCAVVEKILSEEPSIGRVVIATFKTNFSSDVIEDTIKCLQDDKPLIIIELKHESIIKDGKLWKIMQPVKNAKVLDLSVPKHSIIVVFADLVDEVNAIIYLFSNK